jgi:hypothetical protein
MQQIKPKKETQKRQKTRAKNSPKKNSRLPGQLF